jgi:transposase
MKQVTQVGVDVDSEALVCAMQRAEQRLPLATFANTAAGHKKFIRWATKGGRQTQVCLEATGIYSLEFALALHHAKNVEVMVVNPRAIKDFVRACMQRAKTDAVDAGGILEYLQRMPFAAWQPPAPEILELQAINRRIVQLNTELTREKNRRHASEVAGASADAIAHDIEVNIHHLERRLERMHNRGLQLVRGVPALATKLAHLVSTKGIGEASAMRLLAELLVLRTISPHRSGWRMPDSTRVPTSRAPRSIARGALAKSATVIYALLFTCPPWWPFNMSPTSTPSTTNSSPPGRNRCKPWWR